MEPTIPNAKLFLHKYYNKYTFDLCVCSVCKTTLTSFDPTGFTPQMDFVDPQTKLQYDFCALDPSTNSIKCAIEFQKQDPGSLNKVYNIMAKDIPFAQFRVDDVIVMGLKNPNVSDTYYKLPNLMAKQSKCNHCKEADRVMQEQIDQALAQEKIRADAEILDRSAETAMLVEVDRLSTMTLDQIRAEKAERIEREKLLDQDKYIYDYWGEESWMKREDILRAVRPIKTRYLQ